MLVVSGRCLQDGSLTPFQDKGKQTSIEQLFSILEKTVELHESPLYRSQVLARIQSDYAQLWPLLETQGIANQATAEQELKDRGLKEAENMRQLLERQKLKIKERIGGEEQQKLIFSEKEKEQKLQYQRDLKFMEKRLEAIDREIQEEPVRIQSYYQTKRYRIEPIGMVYLWPKN